MTNHTLTLLCIARDPQARLVDIAQCAGIAERNAMRIITDLVERGYITRERIGKGRGSHNRYTIDYDAPLPEPHMQAQTVGQLIRAMIVPELRLPSTTSHPIAARCGVSGALGPLIPDVATLAEPDHNRQVPTPTPKQASMIAKPDGPRECGVTP